MRPFKLRFIIGKLEEEEIEMLRAGEPIVTKMILTPDDHAVFHYKDGDLIEVETQQGDRLWTIILEMETLASEDRVIIIFTLKHAPLRAVHQD